MRAWKILFVLSLIAVCPATLRAAAFTNYTGLDGGGWTVDYQLHIANSQDFSSGVPYNTNNSASIATGSFSRVAYVMEVQSGTGPDQYVFVSFDAAGFQTNASLLGVPNATSGEVYQQNVNNLHVLAGGGAPVTTGVFSGPSGNVEFWPSNYEPSNAAGVPGASNDVFDTGDKNDGGNGYGSMQIHNHNTTGTPGVDNEVLIAFNQWNGGGELGLGNQVGGSGNPDWTFSNNAGSYTIKDLQILVLETPEPSSIVALVGLCGMGLILWTKRRKSA